jgi:hypothetical protein
MSSFFGFQGKTLYNRAAAASGYNYKEILDQLNQYDFSNIKTFIISLNKLGVMPNLNEHLFTSMVVKKLQFSFLPALEDIARFFAILTASNTVGATIVPPYLYKYNERAFNNVLEFSKGLFKRL